MRKEKKEQIVSILKLMADAHVVMKKQIEKENIQPVLALMEDCQNAVITIGNQIEKTEGTECVTIRLLEKYCELIYQLFETLICIVSEQMNINEQAIDKNVNETVQALDELLEQISDSIKNEITVQKEAVFLPYKASMWDSLESVWKAADEDPNCDAYVIPIPYFDRISEGGFGEMHYEGDLYPKYVPVADYKEFDFEEHRPDMIYIHNPYDEYNLVTSVHPDFYSSKLKSYTENLIYIPYFVLGEVDPENEEAVENMAHFCKTPAVLNADKVIVQSEQMKQVYVKVLTEWMGEDTRQKWEEKILGLGSPKLDKVANTKKEDLEIPKEWLKVIKKSDGSWKKVIFYNTSLSAFLKNSDTYFDKVEDVLQIFKENKDDIALLWRPHPLFMQTLESMRAELKERYIQIVQKYKMEQWGIYDKSVELDRAIAVSDAYYGDASSVVQLCQEVGMPILIQSSDVYLKKICDNKKKRLLNVCLKPRNIFVSKKNVYLTDACLLGTCVMNKDTGEIDIISYDIATNQKFYNFSNVIEVNRKLIVTPFYHDSILEYDLDKKCSIEYKVKDNENEWGRYTISLLNQNEIWMIPWGNKDIVKYNVDENEWREIEIKGNFNDAVICCDKLYLPDFNKPVVTILDCKTLQEDKIKIENAKGFSTICIGEEGTIWLKDAIEAKLYAYRKNKCTTYNFPQEGRYKCRCVGNSIYVFGENKECVLKLDEKTGIYEDITMYFEKEPVDDFSIYFKDVVADTDGNTIWAINMYRGTLYSLDTKCMKVLRYELTAPFCLEKQYCDIHKEIYSELPRGKQKNDFIMREIKGIHDLEGYIDAMISNQDFSIMLWKRKQIENTKRNSIWKELN